MKLLATSIARIVGKSGTRHYVGAIYFKKLMSKQDSILFSKKGGVGDVSRIITLLIAVLMLTLLLLLIVTEVIAIWIVYVNYGKEAISGAATVCGLNTKTASVGCNVRMPILPVRDSTHYGNKIVYALIDSWSQESLVSKNCSMN